jgi:hypothetical protein
MALVAAIVFGFAEPHARGAIFFCAAMFASLIVKYLTLIVLFMAIAVGAIAIWRSISDRARSQNTITYSKVDRGRWSDFKPLQFGYIPYQPLLREDESYLPIGVGVELLKELLDDVVDLRRFGRASRWDEIDEHLADPIAVFATPLIATFERTKSMAFSSPLFFSNMGLFLKKEYAKQFNLMGCTHAKMKEHIDASVTPFLAVPGEISQNLARRYISKSEWKRRIIDIDGKNLGSLFEEIANARAEQPRAIFCESIHAHFNKHCISGEVVNVLSPGSILYPVCFALRKGDYQLKNLINLRLLAWSRKGGILADCAEKMADQAVSHLSRPISKDEVLKHYVDHWQPAP